MSKFRKKPVVIEAVQWLKNGDHPEDYSRDRQFIEDGIMTTKPGSFFREHDWEGGVVRYYRRPDVSGDKACNHCNQPMHVHGSIDTKEGGHIVCPGDWIITGIQGEYYPCKPDIFENSYELVTEAETARAAEAVAV